MPQEDKTRASEDARVQVYKKSMIAAYEADGQLVELSPEIVKSYMVSGDKEKVSMEEVVMFMNLCKYSGLNPWAKEAYCIKYGNEPATMVVSKEGYIKRAESNKAFDGFEAGIAVCDSDGNYIRREGCMVYPDDDLLGGWARVYRKDRSKPYVAEVSLDEYAAKRKDGTLNSQWARKPATMIRKVALVNALKEAFPSAFGGMAAEISEDPDHADYLDDEYGTD